MYVYLVQGKVACTWDSKHCIIETCTASCMQTNCQLSGFLRGKGEDEMRGGQQSVKKSAGKAISSSFLVDLWGTTCFPLMIGKNLVQDIKIVYPTYLGENNPFHSTRLQTLTVIGRG